MVSLFGFGLRKTLVGFLVVSFLCYLLAHSSFLGTQPPVSFPTPKKLSLPSLLSRKEPIHIVFSSDNADKRAVEASVESIKKHSSSPVHFHYIGEEPLTYNEAHFIDLQEVIKTQNLTHFINTNNRTHLNELNTNFANFARLVLPYLLPDVDKVMYFDADTTILCDIAPFFHSILNDGITYTAPPLAAVPRKGLKGFGKDPKEDIPLSFNAGVLGMRLDLWRKQNLTERIREITLSNQQVRRYKLGSQPPLAILFGANFERLPLAWNRRADQETLEKARKQDRDFRREREDEEDEEGKKGKKGKVKREEEVCVVHWKGAFKPWKEDPSEKKKFRYVPLWKSYDIVGKAQKFNGTRRNVTTNNI